MLYSEHASRNNVITVWLSRILYIYILGRAICLPDYQFKSLMREM